jgi:hypothetical protein
LTLESKDIEAIVRAAAAEGTPLRIRGGDTKAFYGRQTNGQALDVSGHAGIISYEPTELVITARAGTRLNDIESALAESNQMLPFEPPHFGDAATLGGAVASGLSGPARPYMGALRDFMLGVVCINGEGERLSFGGQVMKNVAGYDVSRLMANRHVSRRWRFPSMPPPLLPPWPRGQRNRYHFPPPVMTVRYYEYDCRDRRVGSMRHIKKSAARKLLTVIPTGRRYGNIDCPTLTINNPFGDCR